MPTCLRSLEFEGYSNLQNGDILKMSNLKLSQPSVHMPQNILPVVLRDFFYFHRCVIVPSNVWQLLTIPL